MDSLTSFEALVIPSDDRAPHLVSLMTSPLSVPLPAPTEPFRCQRMPHPEVFMDYIAENLGPQAWGFQVSSFMVFPFCSKLTTITRLLFRSSRVSIG